MEKSKFGIVRFFYGYFQNLGKIILTNLLFAVPFVSFTVLFYFINLSLNLDAVAFLPIIFIFPFYSGVVLVTRNLVRGDKNVQIVKLFFKSFKENFLKFLFHGVILYLSIFLCYFSITSYWKMSQDSEFFFLLFAISIIIAVVLLFMFFNIPTMTVTFELSLKNIYKNCFLMTFGELKNNFFSLVGLFLLCLVTVTIFFTSVHRVMLIILTIIMVVFIIPTTVAYIINFYIYKDMESIIVNKNKKANEIKEEIEKQKQERFNKNVLEADVDFSTVDLDERKDMEEYLFFNGKMIKRKVLIEMKKRQENINE